MSDRVDARGAAERLYLAGTPLLRADEQVFEGMLEGWEYQQRSRGLKPATIEHRRQIIRRFHTYAGLYPWQWHAADFESWITEGQSRPVALSTMRGMQNAVSMFCDYLTDLRYKWIDVCEQHFGATPSQVVFEWNAVTHRHEHEGRTERRGLRPNELQVLFDVMDEHAVTLQRAGKKGWQAALRDAAMFKTCYAFGLRRAELAGLILSDIGANPHAPEFGGYGVIYVRYGKGSKGSGHKRRSVLTFFDWSVEVLRAWVDEQRPLFPASAQNGALWPSERESASSLNAISRRFTIYREMAGLPQVLSLHALRHSYVTHLIEAGVDPVFVQEQVGHSHASTTSIYTSVSSDFRTRTLRDALDTTMRAITERRAI